MPAPPYESPVGSTPVPALHFKGPDPKLGRFLIRSELCYQEAEGLEIPAPGSGLCLGKQLLDNAHGQEQLGRLILEKRELVVPVKRNSGLALRIDDDCERGNHARRLQAAGQGIHQKILSRALPLQPPVDSQASKKRCRDDWVLGEFLRHVLRPRANIDADGRKRVVTENRGALAFTQHKRSGNALARVLPRLRPQVLIERLAAAGKL